MADEALAATPADESHKAVDDDAFNGGGHEVQIESSDEYDPAQSVSLSGPPVPVSSESHLASNNAHDPAAQTPNSVTSASVDDPEAAESSTPNPVMSVEPAKPSSSSSAAPPSAAARTRLPHDTIGILEDRIKDDEKGDTEAWLSLIGEYKTRGKIDEIRKVYDRFFTVFPHAAEQWIDFAKTESDMGNKAGVEAIFNKALTKLPHRLLWCTYLDHVRRYHNISLDKSGTRASQINHAAYEAVLDVVGMDKDSGKLWQEYIDFIKSGPGVIGQSDWQAQSKMDLLRKAYQRAISIPTQAVESIWKDYSSFEMGLNKTTGRKFVQDKSPHYMTARSSFTELQNITRDLKRTTMPILPPALGFDGDVEFTQQVAIWNHWIRWEKTDPLVLKEENPKTYQGRVVFVYRQALMALRFWPEMWFDAAEFCFDNGLVSEGNDFLAQGIEANPESCLLAFKRADRLETQATQDNDDSSKHQRGLRVREPYDRLLNALYELIERAMEREKKDLARIEAEANRSVNPQVNGSAKGTDEDDEMKEQAQARKQAQIGVVKAVNSAQLTILNRTVSHAWIALMRAMQRMQGKGKPSPQPGEVGGSRQIFTEARRRGRITSDIWVAAALLEFHNSDAELAKKIFERGMRLFPEDESFCLEYMKLLTNANDHTNARAVFETTVNKLLQKPDLAPRAKSLFVFFHRYESCYGELAQVTNLERRMREAFPDDPKLSAFSQRFVHDAFDPTAIRPLISPATQTRPKALPSVEGGHSRPPSPPAIKVTSNTGSPKRPAPETDDADVDAHRPRKLARGESPLAGAAGRRLKQARPPLPAVLPPQSVDGAVALPGQGASFAAAPPPPLPREITFLLSIIPPAAAYGAMHFRADEMVRILGETNMPESAANLPGASARGGAPVPPGYGLPSYPPVR